MATLALSEIGSDLPDLTEVPGLWLECLSEA